MTIERQCPVHNATETNILPTGDMQMVDLAQGRPPRIQATSQTATTRHSPPPAGMTNPTVNRKKRPTRAVITESPKQHTGNPTVNRKFQAKMK
jgi:hypothetical protein